MRRLEVGLASLESESKKCYISFNGHAISGVKMNRRKVIDIILGITSKRNIFDEIFELLLISIKIILTEANKGNPL